MNVFFFIVILILLILCCLLLSFSCCNLSQRQNNLSHQRHNIKLGGSSFSDDINKKLNLFSNSLHDINTVKALYLLYF